MYKLCRTEKSLARQRELENGFLDYLGSVSFFKMEIADLCRYLNIPRKTFYRYFGSKEDALYALIDHRLEDLARFQEGQVSGQNRTLRQDAVGFFTYWKEQKRLLDILNSNFLGGVISIRSVKYAAAIISPAEAGNSGNDSANDYIINFLVTGMSSMMLQWYTSGFQKSIEELADITEALLSHPISNMLYYDK